MSLGKESDETLLALIRRDSEAALRELLSRYFTRLANFAYSIVRRRDLAQEAALNVFLNIWKRRATFAPRGPLRNYLFAAVGNQSFTLRRTHAKNPAAGLDEVPDALLVDPRNPNRTMMLEEFRSEIEALVSTLPRRRQLIFRMNRFEGLGYAEIAEALGLSQHTVQNHMIQAMKQLAPHLAALTTR